MTPMVEQTEIDMLPSAPLPDEPLPVVASRPAGKPPGDGSSTERLDEREQREIERDRSYWREQAMRGATAPAPVSDDQPEAPPKVEDFDDYLEFERAQTRYEARQEVARVLSGQERRAQETRRIESARARLERGREKYEDFEEVALSEDTPISEAMLNAMEDSPHFGDIAYFLGKNQDEARRIVQLSPAAAAREIGRIEDKFLNASEAKSTGAPAKAGKAGSKTTKHPSKMTTAEYRKWRESGGGGRGSSQ